MFWLNYYFSVVIRTVLHSGVYALCYLCSVVSLHSTLVYTQCDKFLSVGVCVCVFMYMCVCVCVCVCDCVPGVAHGTEC